MDRMGCVMHKGPPAFTEPRCLVKNFLAQIIRFRITCPLKNRGQNTTKWAHFLYALTSWNIDQFSNLFHCQNQNICNYTITKDPTTPQVCRYTTLWNASVLKATTKNETTSVTTNFNSAPSSSKADTLNLWCKNCRMWKLLYTITERINTSFSVVNATWPRQTGLILRVSKIFLQTCMNKKT